MCCVFEYCQKKKGTPSALKNPSEETWVTDESPSRRKSTPGDASMRRSIQDLALSMDPNIKIEPEVEDVRQLPLFYSRSSRVHPLIASFGYCRRVHRLGHQFWVPSCQASRRRHVRSEGLATSSRCVARPSSVSRVMALRTTDAERNHNIRIPGFASDMTPIALSQAGVAPTTQSAQSTKKGAQGTQNSLRAHRLAQVAQAKREAKLM